MTDPLEDRRTDEGESRTPATASTTAAGFAVLTPGRRRRVLAAAIARTAAAVMILVVVYFRIPMDHLDGPLAVPFLVVGLITVAVVLVVQIRATVNAPYPALRAVESLGVSVPLLLLVFSTAHYLLELSVPGSYTQSLTRLDALYFSVTMFTTVGFGDIAAVSQVARVVTTLQMLANLIFLGVVARVLFGAALGDRRGRGRGWGERSIP